MSSKPKYQVGDEVYFAFGSRIEAGVIKEVRTFQTLPPDYVIEHTLLTPVDEKAVVPRAVLA